MNPVRKLRYNTEVGAASSDGPKKIGVRFFGGLEHSAIGKHDFGRKQVVADESKLASQDAGSTSECDTSDPCASLVTSLIGPDPSYLYR
jgi:hypothetical protein